MILDLSKGCITSAQAEAREYINFDAVSNTPATAVELGNVLRTLSIPEEVLDGMDYKDHRSYMVGLWVEILGCIHGAEITSVSDGGKYGHVYFTYKGEEVRLGYDDK